MKAALPEQSTATLGGGAEPHSGHSGSFRRRGAGRRSRRGAGRSPASVVSDPPSAPLRHSTPDSMLYMVFEGVLQAERPHRALGTISLRGLNTDPVVGEKDLRVNVPATGQFHPQNSAAERARRSWFEVIAHRVASFQHEAGHRSNLARGGNCPWPTGPISSGVQIHCRYRQYAP
jgi:hypothetical protein